ncbi:MAG: glycosyltransferase family 2 protein [Chthoniobacterales bacterium]
MTPDPRRGVIIPTYNSGPLLESTVRQVLAHWSPVVVVVDGSTDGSEGAIETLASGRDDLHIHRHSENLGKGAAVLSGLEFAVAEGWSHAAVFDADGQHEAADLPRFMEASRTHPQAMILGRPVFGADAPSLRVVGRRAGNWFANVETWWGGINDSLFGLRVYPVGPALDVLRSIRGGRRFDFDTQLAVRLYWLGVPPLNLPTRVHYRPSDTGGVSHFHYLRDNLLLARAHAGLLLHSFLLAPRLANYRRRSPLAAP